MTDHLTEARAFAAGASQAPDAGGAISWLTATCEQIIAHLEAQQTSPQPATAPPAAQQGDSGHRDGDLNAQTNYAPQAWRLTGYYPESYARLMDILIVGILPDWDDDDRNRHEAEFRADLAAHDAEVAAQALREAAEVMLKVKSPFHWQLPTTPKEQGTTETPPVWLRSRADLIKRGSHYQTGAKCHCGARWVRADNACAEHPIAPPLPTEEGATIVVSVSEKPPHIILTREGGRWVNRYGVKWWPEDEIRAWAPVTIGEVVVMP